MRLPGESGNVPGARKVHQAILQTLTNPENWSFLAVESVIHEVCQIR